MRWGQLIVLVNGDDHMLKKRCSCMIIVVTCFICRNWFRNCQGMMRGRVTVVMVIDILAFMCVSHVTLNRTVRKMSRRDTSHKLTTARNFRELLGMDWYYGMQQGLDCYSLRCDLVKVPEKTSGLVDTGASQVVLGLFVVFRYGSRSFWFVSQVHHQYCCHDNVRFQGPTSLWTHWSH